MKQLRCSIVVPELWSPPTQRSIAEMFAAGPPGEPVHPPVANEAQAETGSGSNSVSPWCHHDNEELETSSTDDDILWLDTGDDADVFPRTDAQQGAEEKTLIAELLSDWNRAGSCDNLDVHLTSRDSTPQGTTVSATGLRTSWCKVKLAGRVRVCARLRQQQMVQLVRTSCAETDRHNVGPQQQKLFAYTDASVDGDRGSAAICAQWLFPQLMYFELDGQDAYTGTTRPELQAILACAALCPDNRELVIYSDNRDAVETFNGVIDEVQCDIKAENPWLRVLGVALHRRNGGRIRAEWVRAHDNRPGNCVADALAKACLQAEEVTKVSLETVISEMIDGYTLRQLAHGSAAMPPTLTRYITPRGDAVPVCSSLHAQLKAEGRDALMREWTKLKQHGRFIRNVLGVSPGSAASTVQTARDTGKMPRLRRPRVLPDTRVRILTTIGEFPVRDTIVTRELDSWRKKLEPRPIRDEAANKTSCAMCQEHRETMLHLFQDCGSTKETAAGATAIAPDNLLTGREPETNEEGSSTSSREPLPPLIALAARSNFDGLNPRERLVATNALSVVMDIWCKRCPAMRQLTDEEKRMSAQAREQPCNEPAPREGT